MSDRAFFNASLKRATDRIKRSGIVRRKKSLPRTTYAAAISSNVVVGF
jgi:hypothetical protein